VKALLENRARYQGMAEELGREALFAQEPHARGYLRPGEGYRLFDRREELCRRLTEDIRQNREWLMQTLAYPLAV
jgi:deoxyhypusine synthase